VKKKSKGEKDERQNRIGKRVTKGKSEARVNMRKRWREEFCRRTVRDKKTEKEEIGKKERKMEVASS
jgi:hypothetical protein